MKQFIKFLFASCLGTIFAFGLMFFGLFLFGSMFSAKDMSIPSNSVLLLDFKGVVPEKSNNVSGHKITLVDVDNNTSNEQYYDDNEPQTQHIFPQKCILWFYSYLYSVVMIKYNRGVISSVV